VAAHGHAKRQSLRQWTRRSGVQGYLLRSPTSSLPPILPPRTAGDTWNIKLYYDLGATSPFTNARFPGSTTRVRLRADGNNTTYAVATASSEIVPSVTPAVSQAVAGDTFHVEKQAIVFDAAGGSFRLSFAAPTGSLSTAFSGTGTYVVGTTGNIPADAPADQIGFIINSSLQFYTYANGHTTGGPFNFSQIGQDSIIKVANWTRLRGFTIEYGTPRSSNNANPYVMPLPLVGLDDTGFTFDYGWNVTLVLDGNGHTFSDLFIPANGPAYLEILLTQPGDVEKTAAQQLLPSVGDAPTITTLPPYGGAVGQAYDFIYQGDGLPTWAVTSGTLPGGLSLSSSGEISGTPTTAGTFNGTVTATNPYGTASQPFSIAIAGGTSGGGPSANCYYDGNFNTAKAAGEIRFSRPIPQDNSVLLLKQRFWQLRSQWSPLAMNSSGPFAGQNTYLVDETELEDLGGGIVAWDRVWATLPPPRTEKGSAVKTFKYLQKSWRSDNHDIYDVNIATQSRVVRCNVVYHYSLDPNSLAVNGIPDISIISINVPGANQAPVPVRQVWNTGGFPVNLGYGTQADSNAFYTLISCEIGIWMGAIYYRKTLEGEV
jgi:hypothetical protein